MRVFGRPARCSCVRFGSVGMANTRNIAVRGHRIQTAESIHKVNRYFNGLEKSRHFRYVFSVFVRTPVHTHLTVCIPFAYGNFPVWIRQFVQHISSTLVFWSCVGRTTRNGYTAFRKRYETFKSLTTSFGSYRTTLPESTQSIVTNDLCHRRKVATTSVRINVIRSSRETRKFLRT